MLLPPGTSRKLETFLSSNLGRAYEKSVCRCSELYDWILHPDKSAALA